MQMNQDRQLSEITQYEVHFVPLGRRSRGHQASQEGENKTGLGLQFTRFHKVFLHCFEKAYYKKHSG